MVKAKAMLPDGRALIVLGLSEGNITRLRRGQPIYVDPAQLKIQPGTTIGAITIFLAADEGELTRTMKTLIGPQTEVIVVPHGDDRPQ